jgi:hypothetical protein
MSRRRRARVLRRRIARVIRAGIATGASLARMRSRRAAFRAPSRINATRSGESHMLRSKASASPRDPRRSTICHTQGSCMSTTAVG